METILATRIGKNTFVEIKYFEPLCNFISDKKNYQQNAIDVSKVESEIIDIIHIYDVSDELQATMAINGITLFDDFFGIPSLSAYERNGKSLAEYYRDLDCAHAQMESDSVRFCIRKINESKIKLYETRD